MQMTQSGPFSATGKILGHKTSRKCFFISGHLRKSESLKKSSYLKKIQHIVTIVKRGQCREVNVMKKEALLVIDMLNDFVLPGASLEVPDTRTIIPVIQKEIGKARAAGNPVIYVCDAHAPDDKEFKKFGWPAHAVKGTRGSEVVEELKPAPGDRVIPKDTYSGFYGTRLDETLKDLGVDSLRLTGCVTHICIMFTASDAVLRDYKVTVVENGVAGIAREDHDAALRIMKNVMGVHIVKSGSEASGRIAA
jgi:nicotinamidase-related amidase